MRKKFSQEDLWDARVSEELSWRKVADRFKIASGTAARFMAMGKQPLPNAEQPMPGKKIEVYVLNGHIAPGSLVLGRTRRCKNRRCRIPFVPATANQKYHAPECRPTRKY